jgi:hypothetical protein
MKQQFCQRIERNEVRARHRRQNEYAAPDTKPFSKPAQCRRFTPLTLDKHQINVLSSGANLREAPNYLQMIFIGRKLAHCENETAFRI